MATLSVNMNGGANAFKQDVTYADCRAAGGGTSSSAFFYNPLTVVGFEFGQHHYGAGGGNIISVCQNALSFDTSSIPDTATITAATLKMWVGFDGSTLGRQLILEVYAYDYGASWDFSGDWIGGANFGGLTLLGTFTLNTGTHNAGELATFVESGSALRDAINKTGDTRVVIIPQRFRTNNPPVDGTYESIQFKGGGFGGGTTEEPLLEVTYTTSVTHTGAAVLPTTTTLAATGQGIKQATQAITASLSLASAGATTHHGASALALSAALASAGTMTRTSGALLPTAATLSADAQVGAILGQAALALATTLSPRAGLTQHAQQATAVSVTLQAEGVLGRPPPLVLKSVRPQAGTGSYGILPAAGSGRRR
jgi:hypothetical protein